MQILTRWSKNETLQIINALSSANLRLWTLTALLTVAINNHHCCDVERMFWNKVNCSFILCNYYLLLLMFVSERREQIHPFIAHEVSFSMFADI